MSKNTLKITRPYLATLRVEYDDYFRLLYRAELLPRARLVDDHFVAKKIFRSSDRREAVRKIVQWFWKDFKGNIGPAHKVLTINDPYEEVHYSQGFSCADPINKYLGPRALKRVIRESGGKVVRDEREGSVHHPPNSVRRVKRRRKYHRRVAPRLSVSSTGALYYRVTLVPQISKKGVIVQKRKIQNVRLNARNLEDALVEIIARGLDSLNSVNTLRKFQIKD
ncbi:MAG: hypothetical protein VW879_10585 [Opitutae bacterium]